jgi:hypothetical protein
MCVICLSIWCQGNYAQYHLFLRGKHGDEAVDDFACE